jgi:hypothetical protein
MLLIASLALTLDGLVYLKESTPIPISTPKITYTKGDRRLAAFIHKSSIVLVI